MYQVYISPALAYFSHFITKNRSAAPRVTSFLSRRVLLLQNSSKHSNFLTLCEHYANKGYPHTYAP
jgi:hypothetical protein